MTSAGDSPKIAGGGHEACARLIAYYLPQFHPIPENDAWWGTGFTEWTNVAKAKPLFPGHYQPHVPADLGFYDLRVPEVRAKQADMAREVGIEAFCYWHYWFGAGKVILERPLQEVLKSGEPDFPFCIAWANESWTGIWYGAKDRILSEQTYPGPEDYEAHYRYVSPFLHDRRYFCVDGKPLVQVLRPEKLPNAKAFTDQWRELADKDGLPGLHFIGFQEDYWPAAEHGFDGATFSHHNVVRWKRRDTWHHKWGRRIRRRLGRPEHVYTYEESIPFMHGPEYPDSPVGDEHHPCIVTGWDNTPRSEAMGTVLTGYTPELFRTHVRHVLARAEHKPLENRLVFVKSWNEWAEGNYLEPEMRYGRAYLDVLKEEVCRGV
jgi:lipopolysaccharide biosynthesis protein